MSLSSLLLAAAMRAAAAPAPLSWKPDWPVLKAAVRGRIERTLAEGRLPILDVENSYNDAFMNGPAIQAALDKRGIVAVAWSPEEEERLLKERGVSWWLERWPLMLKDLAARVPGAVLPVPPAGGIQDPASQELAREVLAQAEAGGFPMLGEYFFRHYSSDLDVEVSAPADLSVPIDGPFGRELFAYAERTGKPFELHYEVEDALLPALERMLSRYPKARVIWCHAARVRYPGKATRFLRDPAGAVRGLLERHPNLYFDLSSLGLSVYPGNGQVPTLWWDPQTHHLYPQWERLLVDHPWRFMTALDTGMDRAADNPGKGSLMRGMLLELPPETRRIVAYRAFWKLVFGETLPDGSGPAR